VGFPGKIEDFGDLTGEQKRTIRKGLKVMCREIQMGVATAQLAMQDAGLRLGIYDVDRTVRRLRFRLHHDRAAGVHEGVRHCLTADGQFDFSRWAVDGCPR
jgi:3-oxoacyl-[acyl-carrier-protein] synthase II